MLNSQVYSAKESKLEDIPTNVWKKDPNLCLPMQLHTLFKNKKKKVFDYIKLVNLLKIFSKNKRNNNMTKSFVNLKQKLNTEKALPMKLLAILIEKIMYQKIFSTKLSTFKTLQNKEVKVFKVLFGKVKPMKAGANGSFIGETMSNLGSHYRRPSHIMGTQSYVNFPKNSQIDQISACKYIQ